MSIRHDRLVAVKATATKLSASSPTISSFTVPANEHWHIYAARLQSLGSPGMTGNILIGAALDSAGLNGWPSNTGIRSNILHTMTVNVNLTGDYYTETRPRLYLAPATTFHLVTEYVGVNPGSDWTWHARFVATLEPLTNW